MKQEIYWGALTLQLELLFRVRRPGHIYIYIKENFSYVLAITTGARLSISKRTVQCKLTSVIFFLTNGIRIY